MESSIAAEIPDTAGTNAVKSPIIVGTNAVESPIIVGTIAVESHNAVKSSIAINNISPKHGRGRTAKRLFPYRRIR